MDIDSPEPTLFIKPNFKASLPTKMARQVMEAALGALASKKLQLW
jgi:hypothetical protein